MEFLYRPIERLLEGAPGHSGGGLIKSKSIAKPVKLVVFLVCSAVLAHMFLAYFVSWENLRHWVFGSPTDHPIGFAVVAVVTAGMMLDFGYFREQVCLVACPYGRMQSVMLDKHSMVIRYDLKRGEPRGKKSAKKADVALPVLAGNGVGALGDCIDCSMCVTTCPTGIDIRNGLQMECIGCAQCIDACDSVMDKVGRDRGLIRYSSQAGMEGEKFRVLRPRVVLYPAVILALGALFAVVLMNTGVADVTVLRGLGQPFAAIADGGVRNNLRIKISSRMDKPAEFSLKVEGVEGAKLKGEATTVTLAPGQMLTVPVEVDVPRGAFHDGKAAVMIVISGPEKFSAKRPFTLLGPSDDRDEHESHKKKEHE
jgi:cytochrome c oxidase accessory protein FixG